MAEARMVSVSKGWRGAAGVRETRRGCPHFTQPAVLWVLSRREAPASARSARAWRIGVLVEQGEASGRRRLQPGPPGGRSRRPLPQGFRAWTRPGQRCPCSSPSSHSPKGMLPKLVLPVETFFCSAGMLSLTAMAREQLLRTEGGAKRFAPPSGASREARSQCREG